MRRTLAPLLLALALSACTLTVAPHRVVVTPSAKTVRPGERVTLTAETNFSTDSEILWRLGANDARNPNDPSVLSTRTGPTTTYTAPQEDGTYTVTAETIDEVSLPGEAKITVDSFLGADHYPAAADKDETILAGTLAPGASRVLAIDLSGALADSAEAFIIELGQDLRLAVHDENRLPYASSTSPAFFAAGLDAFSTALAPEGLGAQGIGVARACRGACVIREAVAGTSYVRITNPTTTSQAFELYAYVGGFDDSGEDANDARATAIGLEGSDQGAIETLGDQDYYRVSQAGTLSFSSGSALELRAEVSQSDGKVLVTLRPGESYERAFPGDIVRVYESGDDRAGAASASRYVLELTPVQ